MSRYRPPVPLSARVPEIGALDLLLSVARLGSLGRAAQEHGITQPAAGSRIRHLEGLLGLSLIERSALGSRLTDEGAVVVNWARDVVAAAATLDVGAAALRSGHAGRVRIAASLTVAEYLVPGWMMDLRARRPEAHVSLQVVNSSEVARSVLAGDVGLGFVEGPGVPAGLECEVVGHDRLVLVVAPGHPWATRRRPVEVAELAATSLVQREPGSGTRETVEVVLGGEGDVVAPLVELSSTTAIKVAVEVRADLGRELRAVWAAGRRLGAESRDVLAVARRAR